MLRGVHVVLRGLLFFMVVAVVSCNPGKPDLLVDNITLSPLNPTTIDPVRFTAVIKNNGTKASPPFKAVMKVDDETGSQTLDIPVLKPGASFTVQESRTFNIARNYRVTVYADHSQNVTETNENNNEKYIHFTVTKACPDLEVKSIAITPANPGIREPIKFGISVMNIGKMISSPTNVTVKVGSETNPKIFPIPALNPGAAHTIMRSERLNAAGSYRVTVYADYGNNIVECSETNNERFENFMVR